jgi:hypothetical protein
MQNDPSRSSDLGLDVRSLFDAAPEALLVVDEDLILHANAQAVIDRPTHGARNHRPDQGGSARRSRSRLS